MGIVVLIRLVVVHVFLILTLLMLVIKNKGVLVMMGSINLVHNVCLVLLAVLLVLNLPSVSLVLLIVIQDLYLL